MVSGYNLLVSERLTAVMSLDKNQYKFGITTVCKNVLKQVNNRVREVAFKSQTYETSKNAIIVGYHLKFKPHYNHGF